MHQLHMKVLAKRGQKMIRLLTSEERGRTHTVLVCSSAAGYVVPHLVHVYTPLRCHIVITRLGFSLRNYLQALLK